MVKQSNPDEVICPACVHQFRAIPENVQAELRRLDEVNAQLLEALEAADEAMAWELGGEPLDTLMIAARAKARAAIAAAKEQK